MNLIRIFLNRLLRSKRIILIIYVKLYIELKIYLLFSRYVNSLTKILIFNFHKTFNIIYKINN